MESFSTLLLQIYQAARTLPADEFPEAAMVLLRTALNFDSARLLSVDVASGMATVQGCIMYNVPAENALDWQQIQHKDLVARTVLAAPGTAVAFHSPTLYAGRDHAIMHDYATRYRRLNGLAMVLDNADTGYMDGLSFYRAKGDAHFAYRELYLMHAVMPHLQEALKLNRQLAEPAAHDLPAARGALVIARTDGAIEQCGPRAGELMDMEWHRYQRGWLPPSLLATLSQPGAGGYAGRYIAISCSRVNTLLFLRLLRRSPLCSLTPREKEVACLYGQGVSAKLVAAQLYISPATARNMLQRVYEKLGIHDKASLARLVSRTDQAREELH